MHSVMAVPATVIYFTCYDQLCAALRLRMGDYAQEAPLLAGAIARGDLIAVAFLKRTGHPFLSTHMFLRYSSCDL